jgi:hypothetical protein
MLRIGSKAVLVIISACYEWVTQSLFSTATVLGDVNTKSLYGQAVIMVVMEGKKSGGD